MTFGMFSSGIAPCLAASLMRLAGIATADERPRFVVSGHEQAMKALEVLHTLHSPQTFSDCTLSVLSENGLVTGVLTL